MPKRQAAELIELDGGELRRELLDTRRATFGVAAEAGRARTCASTRGPLFGDAGAFGLRALTLRRKRSRACAATLRL